MNANRGRWKNGVKGLIVFGAIVLACFMPISLPGWTCEPLDYSKGYAIINFYDGYSRVTVPNASLYIQYYENGSTYFTPPCGTLFYTPAASYWFAMKDGYWNASGAVLASQTLHICPIFRVPCPEPDPFYNASYPLYQICPKSAVRINITAINGTVGNYTSQDIPNGYQSLTLSYEILGGYFDTAVWGLGAHLPPQFVPPLSFAQNYSVPYQYLWIAWNGSIEDVKWNGLALPVYDLGICNSTMLGVIAGKGQYVVEGTFRVILGASLYFGFLDDIFKHVIPL